MCRFICFAVFALACFAGCTSEYVPPQESIPQIPAGRGGGETAAGGAAGTEIPTGKGSAVGPSKMAKPK